MSVELVTADSHKVCDRRSVCASVIIYKTILIKCFLDDPDNMR